MWRDVCFTTKKSCSLRASEFVNNILMMRKPNRQVKDKVMRYNAGLFYNTASCVFNYLISYLHSTIVNPLRYLSVTELQSCAFYKSEPWFTVWQKPCSGHNKPLEKTNLVGQEKLVAASCFVPSFFLCLFYCSKYCKRTSPDQTFIWICAFKISVQECSRSTLTEIRQRKWFKIYLEFYGFNLRKYGNYLSSISNFASNTVCLDIL